MAMNGRTKKGGFPMIAKKNQGKFTNWVKKNMPGTSTCNAAAKVMKNKNKFSLRIFSYLRTFWKW